MSLRRTIRALLRLGPEGTPPADGPGWRVLEHLGLQGNFLTWAQREERDLAGLWAACPRADWLVRLAAGAGVERRALAEAVQDCVGELPRVGGGAHHEAALQAAERWRVGEEELGALVHALGQAINEALDSDPALLRARVARHAPVGRRFPEERISADLAERSALSRAAEAIRRRISFEVLRVAIWSERRDAPYR